jgi:hypothetical protein
VGNRREGPVPFSSEGANEGRAKGASAGCTAVDLLLHPALQAGHPDLVQRVLLVTAALRVQLLEGGVHVRPRLSPRAVRFLGIADLAGPVRLGRFLERG